MTRWLVAWPMPQVTLHGDQSDQRVTTQCTGRAGGLSDSLGTWSRFTVPLKAWPVRAARTCTETRILMTSRYCAYIREIFFLRLRCHTCWRIHPQLGNYFGCRDIRRTQRARTSISAGWRPIFGSSPCTGQNLLPPCTQLYKKIYVIYISKFNNCLEMSSLSHTNVARLIFHFNIEKNSLCSLSLSPLLSI